MISEGVLGTDGHTDVLELFLDHLLRLRVKEVINLQLEILATTLKTRDILA